jgi:hypothetical protein
LEPILATTTTTTATTATKIRGRRNVTKKIKTSLQHTMKKTKTR